VSEKGFTGIFQFTLTPRYNEGGTAMAIRLDSLRPSLACFKDPPSRAKDSCLVEGTFHEGASKYSLMFRRVQGHFVFSSESDSGLLAFLQASGFDLQGPETQSSFYYAISLRKVWLKDYAEFHKKNPKSADFSRDLEAVIDFINLGNLEKPDAAQKENFKALVTQLANAPYPESQFLEEHLFYPLSRVNPHRPMDFAMQARMFALLDTLHIHKTLSGELAGLDSSHPLYAPSKEIFSNVISYIYFADPSLNELLGLLKSFATDLYKAEDVVPELPLPLSLGETEELPPLVPLGEARQTVQGAPSFPEPPLPDSDPNRYHYYRVLANSLESSGQNFKLNVGEEAQRRIQVLLQWLKQGARTTELVASLLPEPPPQVEREVGGASATLPPYLQPSPRPTLNQAFSLPTEELRKAQASEPRSWRWLPLTEGAMCLAGAGLTAFGASLKLAPGEFNKTLLAGTSTAGLGCGAFLTHLISSEKWNPYVADSVGAASGALIAGGLTWFNESLEVIPNSPPQERVARSDPPPSTVVVVPPPDPEPEVIIVVTPPSIPPDQRNPTQGWGP